MTLPLPRQGNQLRTTNMSDAGPPAHNTPHLFFSAVGQRSGNTTSGEVGGFRGQLETAERGSWEEDCRPWRMVSEWCQPVVLERLIMVLQQESRDVAVRAPQHSQLPAYLYLPKLWIHPLRTCFLKLTTVATRKPTCQTCTLSLHFSEENVIIDLQLYITWVFEVGIVISL